MALDTLLEEALEAWGYTRAGVIAEIENLPAEAMNHRPAEGSRTVAELALHIVESGMLMAGELTREDGDFTRQGYPEHLAEHAGGLPEAPDKAALIELLRRTHGEGEKKIRSAGELHMLGGIRRFDGSRGTRLAWMYHGIEHESYHRGQLALYARTLGVIPALTKAIHGVS